MDKIQDGHPLLFFSRGSGDVEAHQALLQLRKAITLREQCNELIYSCSRRQPSEGAPGQ